MRVVLQKRAMKNSMASGAVAICTHTPHTTTTQHSIPQWIELAAAAWQSTVQLLARPGMTEGMSAVADAACGVLLDVPLLHSCVL
jgi:hypothetical protein